MSKSARSLFVFALYMLGLGVNLVVKPDLILGPLGFPGLDGLWVRVAGMLVFFLGYYYLQVSRHELKQFIQWSVYARSGVLVFFIAFVLFDFAPPALILFGIIDLGFSLWTELALRSEKMAVASSSG